MLTRKYGVETKKLLAYDMKKMGTNEKCRKNR